MKCWEYSYRAQITSCSQVLNRDREVAINLRISLTEDTKDSEKFSNAVIGSRKHAASRERGVALQDEPYNLFVVVSPHFLRLQAPLSLHTHCNKGYVFQLAGASDSISPCGVDNRVSSFLLNGKEGNGETEVVC